MQRSRTVPLSLETVDLLYAYLRQKAGQVIGDSIEAALASRLFEARDKVMKRRQKAAIEDLRQFASTQDIAR